MHGTALTSLRRTPQCIVGTPEHFRWLYGIIEVVLLLNLLDAIFTLIWIKTRLAEEANILLQSVVNERPIIFVLVKTTLVSLGVLLLWRRRHHPLAVVGLISVFLVYYWLLLYHLRFASLFVLFLFDQAQ